MKRHVITVFALAAIAALFFLEKKVSFEAYANRVLAACESASYRPSCYDKEIPKLMDQISMEDTFKVTRLVQDKDRSYRYCHVLGHELSAREVRKNPDGWKDVVARCPSGLCSNGCIHGGFQERFRTDSFTSDAQIEAVKPDLSTICEDRTAWHPTGLEQASCYHAIGHLTMYITNANIRKSIALCDEVAKKPDGRDLTQLCYDGAFMQIFQPLEPEDFALVKGKEVAKDKLQPFCGEFPRRPRASCWTEGWPLFLKEIKEPAGLVAYCAKADADYRDRCFDALEYVLTAQFGFDAEKIHAFCSGLPAERRGQCFGNAASRLIETDYRNIDDAVSICTRGDKLDPEHRCFKTLVFYSTYNFRRGSPEQEKLCNRLPDPWKGQCLEKAEMSK